MESVGTARVAKERGSAGIILVLMKLGPKLLKIVPKMLKGILSFKTAGAAASVGVYSLLYTWQMAVALVCFILVHEYGHILAMKRCGIKTKGIYLIPGFGGAAVAAERFGSARNESFIAIAGPIFSLVFILPAFGLYYLTGNPIWAAIAGFSALINLFNLFPVNPLDGGRMVKAFVYSINSGAGFVWMMGMMVIAWLASLYLGLSLLVYISIIGLIELLTDYGLMDSLGKFLKTILRTTGLIWLHYQITRFSDFNSWILILGVFFSVVIIVLFIWDAISSSNAENKTPLLYPYIVIADIFKGAKELVSIDPSTLKMKEEYPKMNKDQMVFYASLFVVTAVLMVVIIFMASQVPGVQEAKELLTS